MMNYDVRTVFENWMKSAYELEAKGNYVFALEKYKDAYEIAYDSEDAAKNRAFEGIKRCNTKLREKEEGFAK